MIIVAGTHRVQTGHNAESIYRDLQIYDDNNFVGCACSPIFCPDGSVYIAKKIKKSKWEPNLSTPEKEPKSFRIECKGQTLVLSVIPCIDTLHVDVIGTILSGKRKKSNLVICPSESPRSSLFSDVANLLASRDILFCYANAADSGGSFFNIPDSWSGYLKGHSHFYEKLPPKTEAILELMVDNDCFFLKKGSLDSTPICYHPFPYPIIYAKESRWLDDVEKLKTEILEWLKSSDTASAIEWMDLFLSENLSSLPNNVGVNLKHLRHNILPLFDGDVDSIEKSIQYISIKNIDDALLFWAIRVNNTIDLLSIILKDAPDDLTEDLFSCIKTLKRNRKNLPSTPTIQQSEPQDICCSTRIYR